MAVASLAEEIGLAFGLAFFVVFLELLLLIRDFFVIAICVSPRNLEFELPYARVDCKWRAKYFAKVVSAFKSFICKHLSAVLALVG